MADRTEIQALGASLRGAIQSAQDLTPLVSRIQALEPLADVSENDLDELLRLSLANAVAAQALRGLVEMMSKRRGKAATVTAVGEGGIDE
jgi:hypothetical protein